MINISRGKEREKYFTEKAGYEYGGVMCCRNLGESTYEPEYIKNLISFYSARTSEFISLIVTIAIIALSIRQTQKLKAKGKYSKGWDITKLLTGLAYSVYIISVLELLWSILSIWMMVLNYESTEEYINCKSRSQIITVFRMIYKLTFFLFMIMKIEASLHSSVYAYHKCIYISLKVFIILFVIIGYGSLFSEQLVKYEQFGAAIGGYDCYMRINEWILWIGGMIDALLSIIFSIMFGYKLLAVMKANENTNSKSSKTLQALIFKNTLLSLIALSSTWIFYYFGFQGTNFLGWFASLDFAINNLCIWLMFKHNQMLFKKICCGCFILCGCRCAEQNTKYLRRTTTGSSLSPTNKKHSIIAPSSPTNSPKCNLEMPSVGEGHKLGVSSMSIDPSTLEIATSTGSTTSTQDNTESQMYNLSHSKH